MKRIFKFLAGIMAALIVLLAILLIWRPYLYKVICYGSPDAHTYMVFPQEFMQPAAQPFHFTRGKLRSDLDTLRIRNGADSLVTLRDYIADGKVSAFLVIRNDTVLFERYRPGTSDTTMQTLFSVAKSMVSLAVGKAIDEGLMSGTDPVTKYIPELRSNNAFNGVTIGMLLAMRSGLDFKDAQGNLAEAFLSDEARFYYTADMRRELHNVTRSNKPGTVWKYKSIDAILLGWALEKATGKSVAQYFGEHIWKKIGAANRASWGLDTRGLANTASRFQASPADLAKIGKLMLQRGRFGAETVISERTVTNMLTLPEQAKPALKGWQQQAHHRLWWIATVGDRDVTAEGMRGQRLYIDPLSNTIIVQFADKGSGNYPYRKISRYLSGLPFDYPK